MLTQIPVQIVRQKKWVNNQPEKKFVKFYAVYTLWFHERFCNKNRDGNQQVVIDQSCRQSQ